MSEDLKGKSLLSIGDLSTEQIYKILKTAEMLKLQLKAGQPHPLLKDKVNPAIINVSSIASFLISPSNEMYCASKAFLTSFSESLSLSLKRHNIKVQVLCPGFTLTDFHAKLGYDANDPIFKKFMSSDKVVDISLKYLKKDKVICIPGVLYKFVRIVINFIPRRIFYKFVLFYSQRNSLIKTKTE